MVPVILNDDPAAEIASAAERLILERTGRRIQRLAVEVNGAYLVVRGCTPSYYVKQLAIQAVRELVESMPPAPAVRLDIEVSPGGGVRHRPLTPSRPQDPEWRGSCMG